MQLFHVTVASQLEGQVDRHLGRTMHLNLTIEVSQYHLIGCAQSVAALILQGEHPAFRSFLSYPTFCKALFCDSLSLSLIIKNLVTFFVCMNNFIAVGLVLVGWFFYASCSLRSDCNGDICLLQS